jgi:hypothetical protein
MIRFLIWAAFTAWLVRDAVLIWPVTREFARYPRHQRAARAMVIAFPIIGAVTSAFVLYSEA